MDKLLIYSGYDSAGPHIFPVEPSGSNRHIKLATEVHPAIAQYMANAKKIPGKSQLLIDALGSGEYYGSNKNGDHFPEAQLNPKYTDEYGHKTFMRYAHAFMHHINKDPAKAYGDKVALSVYHPTMHRVQLIVAVHDNKCRDILQRVDSGDYPDVSMGCRVSHDVCSYCHNRAKTRAQYCDHLKYQMNKILPDGRKVMAINWHPKFFDISFVLIGAEKASKVLLKVAEQRNSLLAKSSAELGEMRYGKQRQWWKGADLKSAAVDKKGTIKKEVPLDVKRVEPVLEAAPQVKCLEPQMSTQTLNALAGFPLSEIFSTLAFLGIDPKPEEFQRIVLIKSGQKKLAERLANDRQVFDESSGSIPKNASHYFDIDPSFVSEKVACLVQRYIPHRSCFNPFLVDRLSKYAADDSQWYPNTKSTILTGIPVALGLGGLYQYLKNKAPVESMTKFDKVIFKHPWLFGLLATAGLGTIAGGMRLLSPQPFSDLDTKIGTGYNPHDKTASKKILIPLAMAPLAYMYSGVQRSRARRGERLNRFDRFMAKRPDAAAIASLLGGPMAVSKGQALARSMKTLMKHGSIYSDFGAFALTSGSKLLPAAVLGAMVDATIAKKIGKIIEKRRKNGNPQ